VLTPPCALLFRPGVLFALVSFASFLLLALSSFFLVNKPSFPWFTTKIFKLNREQVQADTIGRLGSLFPF
jgi:hypothetical protein